MDNISLKLDTLCNLTSLTVASHAAAGKLQHTESFSPTSLDMEKDDPGQNIEQHIGQHIEQNIEKEPKEAGNQPTFWNVPLVTRDHERRDTPIYGEAVPGTSSASLQAPEKRAEIYSQDHVKEHAKEPDRQLLQKGATFGNPPGESFEGAHHSESGDQAFMPDKELLPVFPAKVSEFMFIDGTEPPVSNPLSAAQGIGPQELTLELTTVEEFTTTEITNGLAVSERALLMTEPTNGSGPIDIIFDGIAPDLHGKLPPVEPKEAVTQPTSDSIVKDLAAPHQEPALSAEEPPAETGDAQLSAEALSVERVIDDITSVEEPAKTEAQLSDTAEEPEAPALTATPVAKTTAQPEVIAAQKALVHPSETAAEPASFEKAGVVAGEQDVVLQATPVADEPTVEGAMASPGQTPGNLPAGRAEDLAGAGSPSEVDATSRDPLASEPDIKVALEEVPESQEEVAHLTEPAPWEPVGLVEANGHTVLGIDFGAALSKVALKTDEATPATAIPLALIAYEILHKADLVRHFKSQNEYAEESLLYFDQNEFVFCGLLAKKLSLEAAEAGQNRPAIQNLKTFLVRGGANLQIHSDFFPASESLDSHSVLAIYLAYLLRLTRHYLNRRAGKIMVDLDTTIRNFSIPMWIEDRYREDVKRRSGRRRICFLPGAMAEGRPHKRCASA